MTDSVEKRAMLWASGGDTGSSSLAIMRVMSGGTPEDGRYSYPLDGGDLGRCLRLLAIIPEWRARLGEMAKIGPQWAALVKHWDELESLHAKRGQVSDRMHAILRPIEDRDRNIVRLGAGVTMRMK